MADPLLDVGELARRLVNHEAGASSDRAAAAAGVESACGKLKGDLINMLGTRGFSALVSRALSLAKHEHPLLGEVVLDAGPRSCFTGLAEALAASTDEEAAAASASILAQLLGLLVLLLGEELAMQPVRTLWPHVASSFREIGE